MPNRPVSRICNKCRARYQGRRCSCSPDTRASSFERGYDAQWRKVRISTLITAGIPEEQWSLYAVDHNPPYDKNVDPDHTHYNLTPRLIEDHNRKTALEDIPRDAQGNFAKKEDITVIHEDKDGVVLHSKSLQALLDDPRDLTEEEMDNILQSNGAEILPAETMDSQ